MSIIKEAHHIQLLYAQRKCLIVGSWLLFVAGKGRSTSNVPIAMLGENLYTCTHTHTHTHTTYVSPSSI